MDSHEINLSLHGYERLIERTKCKRSQVISYLHNVWDNGKTLENYDKKSPLFKYLKNTANSGGTDRSIRIKGNFLFIFNKEGNAFITCFEIPQKVIQDKGAKRGKVYFI